jgi:hypothetical protein
LEAGGHQTDALVRPPEQPYGHGDTHLGWPQKFGKYQFLSAIQHGGEGHDGGLGLEFAGGAAKAFSQSTIAMPYGKEMVGDQTEAGGHHETAADPEQVGGTPKDLTDGLGVAADADDAAAV